MIYVLSEQSALKLRTMLGKGAPAVAKKPVVFQDAPGRYAEDWGIIGLATTAPLAAKIFGGTILIGSTEYTAADVNLALASGVNIIAWEYSYASPAVEIKNLGTTLAHDDAHIRCKLWTITVTDGKISSVRRHRVGVFPANFGG